MLRLVDTVFFFFFSVPKPVVLISNRYYIRIITLEGLPRQESLLVENLTNAVALDYDWAERKLYWSDTTSTQSRIMRMNDTGSYASREVSVSVEMESLVQILSKIPTEGKSFSHTLQVQNTCIEFLDTSSNDFEKSRRNRCGLGWTQLILVR